MKTKKFIHQSVGFDLVYFPETFECNMLQIKLSNDITKYKKVNLHTPLRVYIYVN